MPKLDAIHDHQNAGQKELAAGQKELAAGQKELTATVKASMENSSSIGPLQRSNSAEALTDEGTPQLISDPHYFSKGESDPHHDKGEESKDDRDCGHGLEYNEESEFSEDYIQRLCNSSSEDHVEKILISIDIQRLCKGSSEDVDEIQESIDKCSTQDEVDEILKSIDNQHEDSKNLDFLLGSETNENAHATALSSPTSKFLGHTDTIAPKKWLSTSTGKLLFTTTPANCWQYVEGDQWMKIPNVEELRLTLRADGAVVVEHLNSDEHITYCGNLKFGKENKVSHKYKGNHPATKDKITTSHNKKEIRNMLVIESMCLNAQSKTRVRAFLYDFWEQQDADSLLKLTRKSLMEPV